MDRDREMLPSGGSARLLPGHPAALFFYGLSQITVGTVNPCSMLILREKGTSKGFVIPGDTAGHTGLRLLVEALRGGLFSYILGSRYDERKNLYWLRWTPEAGYCYSPVQVQKLLFLLERQIPAAFNGPHFHFQPYHYGPFDSAVYQQLEQSAARGLVLIDHSGSPRSFILTAEGAALGNRALHALPSQVREFVDRTCHFVRTQSFSSLVSSIYKAFPEMRANSVFQS